MFTKNVNIIKIYFNFLIVIIKLFFNIVSMNFQIKENSVKNIIHYSLLASEYFSVFLEKVIDIRSRIKIVISFEILACCVFNWKQHYCTELKSSIRQNDYEFTYNVSFETLKTQL